MDGNKPADDGGQTSGGADFQPGETVSPRQSDVPAVGQPDNPAPAPLDQDSLPSKPSPSLNRFSDSDGYQDDEVISWSASEFIAHDKSSMWYIAVAILTIIVAAAVYLLTHDKISTTVIVIVGFVLGFYGARQPRQLQYTLNATGLRVADRYFGFEQFRSFAVVDDGIFHSIVFMPLRRFGQLITIYFDPHDESRIVDLLAARLPIEHKKADMIDGMMRRIRF